MKKLKKAESDWADDLAEKFYWQDSTYTRKGFLKSLAKLLRKVRSVEIVEVVKRRKVK